MKDNMLFEEAARKCSDEDSLDHDISVGFVEDNRLVLRVVRVWDEIGRSFFLTELFESCFIVDECDDDITISCYIRLADENEVSIVDFFLIHRVSLCSEEEIFICAIHYLGRDGNLSFDVLLGEDGHPASDRADERNPSDLVTVGREVR